MIFCRLIFIITGITMMFTVVGCGADMPSKVTAITIVLQADLSELDISESENAIQKAIRVIDNRIDI